MDTDRFKSALDRWITTDPNECRCDEDPCVCDEDDSERDPDDMRDEQLDREMNEGDRYDY